jgi:bifunctional DNA-binding transcriptional regulator/antitoxin component of YhaV-PrlF toxin-antitoxin module
MRETVKVREVAGSVVVTLPQSVREPIDLKPGDRVLVEAAPPRRLVITKEGHTMNSTTRLELEIELLQKRRAALESDLEYKRRQYDKNMPCDEGMSEPDVAMLVMSSIERDRDRIDVQISEKRLELYDLQGGELTPTVDGPPEAGFASANASQKDGVTHAEQIFRAAVILAGSKQKGFFSRKAVRERLGLNNRDWQSGYTAIFQAMRDDHPGAAPQVGAEFDGVFHRVAPGMYELSAKGHLLANRTRSYPKPDLPPNQALHPTAVEENMDGRG